MAKKQKKQTGGESSKCPSCGTAIEASDRFCRQCGAPLKADGKANGGLRGLVGLRGFGIAIVALAVIYAVIQYSGGSGSSDTPAQRIPISELGGGPAGAPNPRAMADQLFNEALAAYESGDSERAREFIPMALTAYAELAELDLDARYHIALLDLASDQAEAALAQADTMLALIPEHLLGLLVAARAHEQLGQPSQAADYYQRFLDAHTPDVAASRQEYLDHGRVLGLRRQTAIEYLRAQGRTP
ncbi:MAG: zinc-ribbon domain-containing protein [Gemmatimonadales bacterium]|jgi:tetratricopeptide (TPR) repeat protein